jgi:hypothetical protein
MPEKRAPLGKPLPPVTEFQAPSLEQIDRDVAQWDRFMPEWAGLLDAKPPGTSGARFWYDEGKRVTTFSKTGKVVTMTQKKNLMIEYQRRLKK